MMRLRVIFPSSRGAYPDREVELRMATLRRFCGSQTQLEFGYPSAGTTFKEGLTWRDFEKIIPEYIAAAKAAEDDGCDAVMIHCVYDPGYVEIRRTLSIPAVGFGQSVFHAAVQIAPRFGLIAPNDSLVKEAHDVLDHYGFRDRLAYIEPLNIELPEAHKRGEELRSRAVQIARRAKEHGAGVVIPFGLALVPTPLSTEDIARGAGIPVLNPAEIGIREAEIIMGAVRR
jgi:allantoin racemase